MDPGELGYQRLRLGPIFVDRGILLPQYYARRVGTRSPGGTVFTSCVPGQ